MASVSQGRDASRFFCGRRWYTSFVKSAHDAPARSGLLDHVELKPHNVVVRMDPEHLFAVFEDYVELYYALFHGRLKKTQLEGHSFHEVMISDRMKLVFDIETKETFANVAKVARPDAACTDDDVRYNWLLQVIVDSLHAAFKTCYRRPLMPQNLVILDGCRESKASFHILIDEFAVESKAEACAFCRSVAEHMATHPDHGSELARVQGLLDAGIYNANSSLRMFRSSNPQKGAPPLVTCRKDIDGYDREGWYQATGPASFAGDGSCKPTNILIFRRTLVGYTHNCVMLPRLLPAAEIPKRTIESSSLSEHDGELLRRIGAAFLDSSYLPPTRSLQPAFKLGKLEKSRLHLMRIAPSVCPTCDRPKGHEHESVGAYLTLGDERFGGQSAFFRCFSKDSPKYLLIMASVNAESIQIVSCEPRDSCKSA